MQMPTKKAKYSPTVKRKIKENCNTRVLEVIVFGTNVSDANMQSKLRIKRSWIKSSLLSSVIHGKGET